LNLENEIKITKVGDKMSEIIDLTYDLEDGMTTFSASWHPQFSITQIGRHEFEGRETRKVTFGTHAGTHMDAPLHFVKCGKSIEKIPIDKLIGEVTIVDFSHLAENEAITKEMLSDINITKRMLFKFGWGKYWGTEKFYNGYPFFSKEAAEYLLFENVELIAMDTPSPDDSRIKLEKNTLGSDNDSPIHKIFLNDGIALIEYIANLDKVKDYVGWSIIVMPLRIKGADGSPSRVCIYR